MTTTNNVDRERVDLGGSRLLRTDELEHVSGGMDLKGASEALTNRANPLTGYKSAASEGWGN
jgi:hypothetical protein